MKHNRSKVSYHYSKEQDEIVKKQSKETKTELSSRITKSTVLYFKHITHSHHSGNDFTTEEAVSLLSAHLELTISEVPNILSSGYFSYHKKYINYNAYDQ